MYFSKSAINNFFVAYQSREVGAYSYSVLRQSTKSGIGLLHRLASRSYSCACVTMSCTHSSCCTRTTIEKERQAKTGRTEKIISATMGRANQRRSVTRKRRPRSRKKTRGGGERVLTYCKYAHWIFWDKKSGRRPQIATLSSQ